MTKHPDALCRFVELFNDGLYFEAHEVLEDLWRETDHDAPAWAFYKGMIQVAVALLHVQRDNPRGARKMHARAFGILEPYAPVHGGVDIDALERDVAAYLTAALDDAKGACATPPTIALIE